MPGALEPAVRPSAHPATGALSTVSLLPLGDTIITPSSHHHHTIITPPSHHHHTTISPPSHHHHTIITP